MRDSKHPYLGAWINTQMGVTLKKKVEDMELALLTLSCMKALQDIPHRGLGRENKLYGSPAVGPAL